jgi:four helix bundle protein
MNEMGNFTNLEVWDEAKSLAVLIYKVTRTGLISKDFGLCDQIRRAAVSVPSNIAEGEESGSTKKSINYFYISKGSLAELYTQVLIAHEVEYLDLDIVNNLTEKINTLSAKLRKLIQYREKGVR